jgi:hypothetical protein
MRLVRANATRKRLLSKKQDIIATLNFIDYQLSKSMSISPESATLDTMDQGTVSSISHQENVTDLTGASVAVQDLGEAKSLENGQYGDFPLQSFLDRPVEIATGTIAVGALLSAEYPIWDIISKHPSVRAKLKNFAFFRGTLWFRIAISGSPFHSGRVLASYCPHSGKNQNLIAHAANLTAAAAYRPLLLNYLSQQDGATTLDVRSNVPVEMCAPFISPKPMLRMFNTSALAIAAATSFEDFLDMGTLYLYSVNTVASVSASAASSNVGYSIFAWFEDVELAVPTATHLAITTESAYVANYGGLAEWYDARIELDDFPIKNVSYTPVDVRFIGGNFYVPPMMSTHMASEDKPVKIIIRTESMNVKSGRDERKSGPIERIAIAGSNISSALMKVPELIPFAMPSKIVFDGAAAFASWFGWSRPIIYEEPKFTKNRAFSNSAVCVGSETVEPLCYDPQRELAIDGFPCGSSHDDMVMSQIFTRESFVETITWGTADAPYTNIHTVIVHPQMNSYYVDGGATPATFVQPSALSFCASPFEYWRGDITFRLDFVTSQYHRGKFGIWYEPNHFHASIINADLSLNKNAVQIIDLSQTDSVEFTVEWASHYPWLRTFAPSDIKGAHNVGAIVANLNEYVNGYIILAPFVPLQSPDNSDIEINIFVKSTNMFFNQMTSNLPTQKVYITPESMDLDTHDKETTSTVLNPSNAQTTDITKHYFGELPLSFRGCLKRYVTLETLTVVPVAATQSYNLTRPIIPAPAPLYNGAAITYPTLLGYLRYAYLGLRGSVKKRIRFYETDLPKRQNITTITLKPPAEFTASTAGFGTTPLFLEQGGSVAFQPYTNAGIEVE